jgi:3-methylcrotonyl-CoA carboxylase alpha subunit
LKTLLIANRGEIACRIARTARRMGIRSVAVYSDADADALHTRMADVAVRIGPASAKESYLNIEALVRAAREQGAEAVHPGYGFLAQSAEFAEACAAAGLIFVGPSPQATRLMGVKDQSKSLMQRAGVPIVPGYLGEQQDEATLLREAQRIGFPLLIKAVAGGGGKGMRVVRTPAEFSAALASARGEAERAFGDDRVMLERYIEHARHVEVQVIADRHGNCLHLFERDCSLQRRYQKIIEEAPAPGLSPQLRSRLHAAAVAAARAVNYENAGTIEFVVGGEEFYFLEMNTRLQVEHPVTELILGIDLVEWQLRVARGEALPAQDTLRPTGHAFEARIYAEDPRRSFLPTGGRLRELVWPAGVRVDAGVEAGDRVDTDYDALLAKLIVGGSDRADALANFQRALRECRIEGVTTNLAALIALAQDPEVSAGRAYTKLIDERGDTLLPELSEQRERALVLAAASVLLSAPAVARSPWERVDGWRLQGRSPATVRLADAEGAAVLRCTREEGRWQFQLNDRTHVLDRVRAGSAQLDGEPVEWHARVEEDRVAVWFDGEWHRFDRISSRADLTAQVGDGTVRAPMPGVVLAVRVREGEKVARGHALVIMEAMKMEHTLVASGAGVVSDLRVQAGARVREGDALLKVTSTQD